MLTHTILIVSAQEIPAHFFSFFPGFDSTGFSNFDDGFSTPIYFEWYCQGDLYNRIFISVNGVISPNADSTPFPPSVGDEIIPDLLKRTRDCQITRNQQWRRIGWIYQYKMEKVATVMLYIIGVPQKKKWWTNSTLPLLP